jgi:copper(I)-binding protein
MHKLFLNLAAMAALCLASLVSLASLANASDVMVSGAYARASAFSAAKSGAVYLTLMNHGASPDRLIAVKSPAADRASLHQTIEENGVARMQPVTAVDLAPGASVELAPNGTHVMLMGLKAPLKKGESVKLTLVFERARELDVDVPIGDVAAMGMDHSGHSGASGN